MAKYSVCCTWVFVVLLQTCIAVSDDIIHLDFENLRAGVPSNPAPSLSETPSMEPQMNGTKVYCTNSVFPSDIFCNVTALGRKAFFKVQPVTYGFYLKYAHPSKPNIDCFLYFENDGETFESKLNYTEFVCYNSQNISSSSYEGWMLSIKRNIKDGNIAVIPETTLLPLRVSDVKTIEIYDRSVENLSFKCRSRFNAVGSPAAENGNFVTFFSDVQTCISSAIPPQLPTLEVTQSSEDTSVPENVDKHHIDE